MYSSRAGLAGVILVFLSVTAVGRTSPLAGDGSVSISGELRRWHKVTLTLNGPSASETGTPNPFLNYRMNVTFTNGGLTYTVPGYFAADGNAANSSARMQLIGSASVEP